jgi:phasin
MTAANLNSGKSEWSFPGMPKFPAFEMPKAEVPAAFRDLAEKGVAQAKDNYEKVKVAAEEATDALEASYTKAAKGFSDYSLKMIEAARSNTNAHFDFLAELFGAKSVAKVVELSTAHARKQFDAISDQSRELTAFAQQLAAETSEPIKGSVSKVFRKAA